MLLKSSADPQDFAWHSFSFLYTATASSAVLSLSAQRNGTGVNYSIDDIAMHVVPEPSSLGLLGLGGIALAVRLLRRRSTYPRDLCYPRS